MTKKSNLNLILQQTNLVNSKKNLKQISLRLRKFERTNFSLEGKKLLLPFSSHQCSAKLLANFIATQLRTIKKRQNFFISFLKESLNIVVDQKFSKIKGIKLIIKGRLNNASRSKHRVIKIGKIPLMTTDSKINYAESTAFTSNGTIGVKIWICEQN
jgi:small subunit ribosomal protein S3